MDRNSAIGLTIIAVLLLVYFNFFAPKPAPTSGSGKMDTTQVEGPDQDLTQPAAVTSEQDTTNKAAIPALFQGEEKSRKVENDQLAITFSNHGGVIKQLELTQFKTYGQDPLYLVNEQTNFFSLVANYQGRDIDLYSMYYTGETRMTGDTTRVIYTAQFPEGGYVKQTYAIPSKGFQIGYLLEIKGTNNLNSDNLTFRWRDKIPLQEKDINDSRAHSTVSYYTPKDGFDGISEGARDLETETIIDPVKWVSIKQKFFLNAIIAHRTFAGGDISTVADANSKVVVKDASMRLLIPRQDVTGEGFKANYYFGPNKYSILPTVAEGFSHNLKLGWPPVIWVSRFVIIPIFQFLENFIGNYGVIIMIMVLIIKLVLTPLSYKSYLGMAKMKLLKPELDLIKEKYGDNMTQVQQEQMKLYQQAGVSPFSGCVPLLLQMPILFAMFYFFPVSIELRQQPFLWAEDLSTYDSVLNLPFAIPFYGDHVSLFVILMTATTLVYQWQNNQISSVTGPMKSMGYVMPVVFMFVLNSFSAGLSFYYFISTLVTFIQQAIIRRFVDESKIMAIMEDHKKKIASGGGGGKSKFMSKLQEAMKASEEARKKSKRG